MTHAETTACAPALIRGRRAVGDPMTADLAREKAATLLRPSPHKDVTLAAQLNAPAAIWTRAAELLEEEVAA